MSDGAFAPVQEGARLTAIPSAGDCYQCGKCTAGCPVAARMDVMPNQLVRLVQLGQAEKAAGSRAIWECVSCQTCTTRCPKSVDCAGIIDDLRQFSVERAGPAPGESRTVLFQKAFLRNIRRNGRLNELELIGAFKTSAFLKDLEIPFLFRNAMLAPRLGVRGKLKLNSAKVRDRELVERIFDRCLSEAEN
ncbi:MAG: 4Fe-4S dicluster domain-containing protein [Acidobacteriota bacterium]